MTRLTNAELEIIRTRPQTSSLYLSIFQPQAVFKAQVNDTDIARGARTIAFDSVSLGAYTDIRANATMWVGTTPGAKDVGKIRVRSASSSEIVVSENDNIDWADELYLTVFYYFELWPVYPRIINDPDNEEDVIFFKDWDIAYTNQNSILGTFLNIGPHRAAWAGEQLYYSSTGTHNLLGNSLSYHWTFEGGSPSSSTSAVPGFVTYGTAGHYVTRCIVSGSNGAVDTRYSYASIYDGSSPPITKWEMSNFNGSRDQGGYGASFKVYEDISLDENSVVVIFTDDFYGGTNQSFGGNYPNGSKIFYVGYILNDSIHYDYQHSYVEFETGSLTTLMKDALGFSVSVESVSSPDVWYELLDMDCRRAIYHYLRWHTTAMAIGDFQFVGTDQKIQFFDADRNSMYDALDNLMRNTLIGKVVSDRQGKVWMEVDAKAHTPTPTDDYPTIMGITVRDWMNEPTIDEQLSDDLSYLEYGGIAYTGVASGTFQALLSAAPGNTPSFRGQIETHEGLALTNQTQLNQLVGNVWANQNTQYPKVSMELGISARNLDIAPQEPVDVNIAASDTVRNIAISGPYIPEGMSWKYDSKNLLLLPTVELGALVDGIVGLTIDVVEPDDGGFNQPPINLPPIPPITLPAVIIPTGTISQIINSTEQPYASYYYAGGVTNSSSRRMLITGISLSSTTSFVQFVAEDAGMYQVSVSGFGQCTGATPGATITININVSIGGIWSFSAAGYTTIPTTGIVGVTCATSRAVYLQGNGNITFQITISNDGGGTQSPASNPEYLVLSAIRVSA